jgi:hypothetical protein
MSDSRSESSAGLGFPSLSLPSRARPLPRLPMVALDCGFAAGLIWP